MTMTSAHDKYVQAVLTKLVALPTNEATIQELLLTGHDLIRMFNEGYTEQEAFDLLKNVEHFNPAIDEVTALIRMANIKKTVDARNKRVA